MRRKILLLLLALSAFACNYDAEKVKLDRYMVAGERIYLEKCANCHQTDGKGLRGLYPPISESDFLFNNQKRVICMLKGGSSDSLKVNGIEYILPMPASGLSNLEIAEVSTFIYNTWGNSVGIIGVKDVEKWLHNCRYSE